MEPEASRSKTPGSSPGPKRKSKAAAGKSRSDSADDVPIPGEIDCLPWAPALVFNLLIAATTTFLLVLLIDRTGLEDVVGKIGFSLPCIPLPLSIVSGAMALTFCWQLVWHYLGEAISPGAGPARIGCIRVPFKILVPLWKKLYFCRLPIPWLWVAAGASTLIVLICLGPRSPFRSSEMPPVVESFAVQGRDGAEVLVPPGGTVEARSGEALRITARVREPSGERCAWSLGRGHLSAVRDCTMVYLVPLDGAVDSLSVRVRSTCQTRDAFAGLGVRLTPP